MSFLEEGRLMDEVELENRQNEANDYLKEHQHAWYLPEVNHLGQIDHVLVYATTGFDYLQAIPALKNLSKLWSFVIYLATSPVMAVGLQRLKKFVRSLI